jgi:signal transduction histidine kinase
MGAELDETAKGNGGGNAAEARRAVYVRAATGVVGIAALIVLFSLFTPEREALTYAPLFAVILIVARVMFNVRTSPGAYFSITPLFLLIYFVLAGAIAVAVVDAFARVAAWLIAQFRRRGTPAISLLSDTGENLLAILAAGLVVQLTSLRMAESGEMVFGTPALSSGIVFTPISSLTLFAGSYFAASSLVAGAVAYLVAGRQELRSRLWPWRLVWSAVSVATAVPFAAVSVILAPSLGVVRSVLFVFLFMAGIAMILQLNVRLREGNRDLRAINRIGRLISATLDQSEIFGIIARESRAVLHWDVFFIATVDESGDELDITFLSGSGERITERRISAGAGLTGRAIATRELVFFEREHESDRLQADELRAPRRPRSIVVAPMTFGQEAIGAISVQSFQTEVYGPSQFRLLQTMAAQAAIAIRNAQLFESEQRATAERDEFLSLVTHEIKNPLTSIKGYASLATASVDAGEKQEARESLEVIETEAQRILRLAEDLLDASKMSAGRFRMRYEDVDLARLADDVANRYRRIASREVEIRVAENFPLVRGDATRLGQVMENLISNAVKYSPDGSAIEVRLDVRDGHVRVDVEDHGEGIPREKLPLIFERFYRVEEGGRVVKGTGLGLFISREIVRMHGGEIHVQSRPGEGSTFTVDFPLQAGESMAG